MDRKKILSFNDKSILEIAQAYGVDYRKIGNKYRGNCIFHNDMNTPNLFLYPENDSFFCFACGAGGDKIKFISLVERVAYGVIKTIWRQTIPLEKQVNEILDSKTENYLDKFAILLAKFFYSHKDKLDLTFLTKYDKIIESYAELSYETYSALLTDMVVEAENYLNRRRN